MFEITVRDHISSAHQLHGYSGPCATMHGHTWQVEVTVKGEQLDKIGILTDFKILKMKLKEVLRPIDHVVLNDLAFFKDINPSTENIARYIYRTYKPEALPLTITKVQVWESDTASVVYYE